MDIILRNAGNYFVLTLAFDDSMSTLPEAVDLSSRTAAWR